MIDDRKDRTAGTGFWIGRGVDETGYAGMKDGTGTHRARLESGVEGAAEQAVIAEGEAGGADGDDFGVGCGV